MLVIDSLARVSVRIGASACSLSRAITARGSLGASFRLSMVPMAMQLYCTLLPLVRAVTGSRKTTSYSRQLLSEEYFAAHRPKRSEEHTSELQPLMSTSSTAFCLKKKKQTKN